MTDQEYTTSHLEELFGIEPGTTLASYNTRTEVESRVEELEKVEEDLNEDKEISGQLNEIYNHAINSFKNQTDIVDTVDPKFSARNAEVAAQFLKVALDTVAIKSKRRGDKDKLKLLTDAPAASITNNNLIVDRNDLIKSFLKADSSTFEQKS